MNAYCDYRFRAQRSHWQQVGRWLVAGALVLAAWLPEVCVAGAPPEIFTTNAVLPPPNGVYVSPADWHVAYASGIVIRGVQHRGFTQGLTPPTGPTAQTENFSSTLDFQISMDNGATYSPVSASALVTVSVTFMQDLGATSYFSTEMTSLNFSVMAGGQTIMVRESPTLPSRGETTVRLVAGGYKISSFFDIFTEISLDGGQTWSPGQQAAHVELRNDPTLVPPVSEPVNLLPPPNDQYVSPALYHALYAQGIVIKDVKHRLFTVAYPAPTPGASQTHSFNSQLDMDVSVDGGQTYQAVSVTAPVTVTVTGTGISNSNLFDTQMTALSFSTQVGSNSLMVRASPTEPSLGETEITPQADGTFRIGSFFDIFTELSLDGGATWEAASNGPVRMQLVQLAAEQSTTTSNLPPSGSSYISPAQWHALYAQGIIISNVSHLEFTQSQPPPPPGGTTTENFNSTVSGQISLNGGMSFQTFTAPASVTIKLTSRPDLDTGNTRYFDTQMLQLNMSGGGLPSGIQLRASPTRASVGRTSIRPDAMPGHYHISSFFDIFTEVSVDSGKTWNAMVSQPANVALLPQLPPPVHDAPQCPSNITVTATGPSGAVVNYTVLEFFGDCPFGPSSLTCTPPSGSIFPVGTTIVTCTAIDGCGGSNTCTFQVTVQPSSIISVPEYFNIQALLPPPGSVYISPAQYHILFANGIVIRDVRHRFFTVATPVPSLGNTEIETFDSEVDCEISLNNGGTYQSVSGNASVTVRLTHTEDNGTVSIFDTAMVGLNLSLPVGTQTIMLRQSPTLSSHGQTTLRPVAGGYMISSFFDIFTEVSLDNGKTWSPSTGSGHVELRADPSLVPPVSEPTPLLPPPNDVYVSPALYHALYAQGIVIKDVRHKLFTQSVVPPNPGQTIQESFNSRLDFNISLDNGSTFQPVRASAPVTVQMTGSSYGLDALFDNQMISMTYTVTVSTASILLRVSPTLPSRGLTEMKSQADGTFRVSSFFDIFTEVSLDGGATWSPSLSGPVRVELASQAPEHPTTSPNLPPAGEQYFTPPSWHAAYPNGIIVSNVDVFGLGPSQPPPTNGGQLQTFVGQASMDITLPGQSSIHVTSASVNGFLSVSNKTSFGNTHFYDTYLQQMTISGGNLPTGIMIRATPTMPSLGRTSVRLDPSTGTYHVGSFFDVFTDISTDSGHSWNSAVTVPGTVGSAPNPIGVFTITCPADITVLASGASGAFVVYPFILIGLFPDCPFGPYVATASPPSGSFFPIGTSTVTVTGSDGCGEHPTCTFHVTVLPRKFVFPSVNLPPLNGQFIPPTPWQGLYGPAIIVSNPVVRRFTQSFPPPGSGQTITDTVPAQMSFQLSTDGGRTFQQEKGNATVMIKLTNTGTQSGGDQVHEGSLLQLNFSAGSPGGVMLRQSPTLPSTGETRLAPVTGGGYMFSSFFDVFTELSLDGGQTWMPASQSAHMEMQPDAATTPTILGNVTLVGGDPTFSLQTQSGLTYLLQFKDNLTDPNWYTLTGVLGTGQQAAQTDFYGSGRPQRFYRIKVEPTFTTP